MRSSDRLSGFVKGTSQPIDSKKIVRPCSRKNDLRASERASHKVRADASVRTNLGLFFRTNCESFSESISIFVSQHCSGLISIRKLNVGFETMSTKDQVRYERDLKRWAAPFAALDVRLWI